MICLRCDNEEFVEKPDAVVEQEFRGETLKVLGPMMACTKCGWLTANLEQLGELRKRTADAYRKKHDLLTSNEIRALRDRLGLSQQAFANRIKAGVASVKRWETWQVQEASMDLLMRLVANQEHESPTQPKRVRVRLQMQGAEPETFIYMQSVTIAGQVDLVQPNGWHVRMERAGKRMECRPENRHDDPAFLSAA